MSDVEKLLASHIDTIRFLLIEKGVVTEKEYNDRHSRTLALADQFLAEQKEKELAAMGPIERILYDSFSRSEQ